MMSMNRRDLIRQGAFGLAATGLASLTLRTDAAPTDATADVHDFQAFLDKNGVPQVQPAGKWSPSHEDILGPFFLQGAPLPEDIADGNEGDWIYPLRPVLN